MSTPRTDHRRRSTLVLLGWLPLAVLAVPSRPGAPGGPAAEAPFARAVDEGTSLRRRCQVDYELTLEQTELEVDGERLPDTGLGVEIELVSSRQVVVEDEYGPSDGERPERLVRYYRELSEQATRTVTGPGGATDESRQRSSDLEGRTVAFACGALDDLGAYDEHPGPCTAAWESDPGEDALLEGLFEDMDLRAFLPDPEASLGAEHTVEARHFLALMRPGGIVLEAPEEAGDAARRDQLRQRAESLEGRIEATFTRTLEDGGRTLAAVGLEVDVASRARQRLRTDSEADVTLASDYGFELEGELRWDGTAGHLAGLELRGTVTFTERMEVQGPVGPGGGSGTRSQTLRYAGPIRIVVAVEPLD